MREIEYIGSKQDAQDFSAAMRPIKQQLHEQMYTATNPMDVVAATAEFVGISKRETAIVHDIFVAPGKD